MGQFREHDRDANEEYDSKVDEDVRSAAAFVGLAGELQMFRATAEPAAAKIKPTLCPIGLF